MITTHFFNLNQHAMKNLTLKLAIVAIAIFAGFGASAQQPWEAVGFNVRGDYNRSDTTVAVYDKVTIGKFMPFWVYPSVAYNPSYVAPSNVAPYTPIASIATADVLSTFDWYMSSGAAAMSTQNASKNYVEASWSSIGVKKLAVVEAPASGVCAGLATRFDITVINEPSLTIVGAGANYGLNNIISSACDAALPIAANHTTAIDVNFVNPADADEYPYYLNMTYAVYNVNKLSLTGTFPNVAGVLDIADADVVALADDDKFKGVVALNDVNGKLNPYPIAAGTALKASQRYEVKNNKITVYVLNYTNANGKISRKSDYIDARLGNWDAATDIDKFTFYPTAATAVAKYIISFPTPVTGPIYHIANNFAF